MSKKGKSNRQDTRSEQNLNEKNKALRAENRRLRKEIKELKKQISMGKLLISDVKFEDKAPKLPIEKCPNCGNELSYFVLDLPVGKRHFEKCEYCGHRKLIKKEIVSENINDTNDINIL